MPYPIPYIAIIDVGHGNSTVLRDGDETLVIDCGAKSSGLLEFLVKEEIKVINRLFISHADQDHIGGLLGILSTDRFAIHEIIVNSDATKGSDLWNDLLYQLDQMNENGKRKELVKRKFPNIQEKMDNLNKNNDNESRSKRTTQKFN